MTLRERLFSGIVSRVFFAMIALTIVYFIILKSMVTLDKRVMGILAITILIYSVISIGIIIIFVDIPLVSLLNKAEKVRFKGDLTIDFSSKGGDEVAHLSRAFQRVMQYFHEMAEVASNIAHGNLKVEVKPFSDKDISAHSFKEMIYNLRNLVEEIRSGAAKLAEASKGFTSVTDQSTQTMSQLANSISQISKAATQVSQAGQTASLSSQQTLSSANSGKGMR